MPGSFRTRTLREAAQHLPDVKRAVSVVEVGHSACDRPSPMLLGIPFAGSNRPACATPFPASDTSRRADHNVLVTSNSPFSVWLQHHDVLGSVPPEFPGVSVNESLGV